MTHTVLVNVPVSSPLHPQANLSFLKGFLTQHGFDVRIYDTNIRFFRWMLGGEGLDLWDKKEYIENPCTLLSYYNHVEAILAEQGRKYPGLQVNLRTISMRHNRIKFDAVLEAVNDRTTNPFIDFYEEFIQEEIVPLSPKLVGIAVIFQDQIIAAFSLASLVRKYLPDCKIVFGGQMITRCWEAMIDKGTLNEFWDNLICWDGELPLLDLHERLFRDPSHEMSNVIKSTPGDRIDRGLNAFYCN